jgi:hypothetical protein
MSAAITEPAKAPTKLSFYSEEHAALLNNIRAPRPHEVAAAKRLVSRQHDAGTLALMIFGEAL